MKGKLLFVLVLGICFIVYLAEGNAQASTSATPLRICFWPRVWEWPKQVSVYGLNIGIANSVEQGDEVIGWDAALLLSQTENVTGFQTSILSMAETAKGIQAGIINSASNFSGGQIGMFNEAGETGLLQLGIINKTRHAKGLQIGLINFLDDGFFPVFPFFNYSKS